jgi:hypothetical protein
MGYIRRATAFAALALASGLPVTAAWASSQASASVTFSYSLIDLTPDDGVTPFFRITPLQSSSGSNYTSGSATAGLAPLDLYSGGNYVTLDAGFQPLRVSSGSAGNQATVVATPTSWLASGQFNEPGQAYDALVTTSVARDIYTSPEGVSNDTGYELSPNSVLVIRAEVAMHAVVSPLSPCGTQLCADAYLDDANVNVLINVTASNSFSDGLMWNDGYSYQEFANTGHVSNGAGYEQVLNPDTGEYEWLWLPLAESELAFDDTRVVTFALTNNNAASLFANVATLAQVYGSSYKDIPFDPDPGVPAVPEPATWATLGIGLLALTAVTRRRRAV